MSSILFKIMNLDISFKGIFCHADINPISLFNKLVVLLIQSRPCCSREKPSGQSVSVHRDPLWMWPWAVHWTLAAPGASLLLTTSSDPCSLWTCLGGICKESNYPVWMLCPKFQNCAASFTLKQIWFQPPLPPPAHWNQLKLLRFISLTHLFYTLFSFLALCGFPNLNPPVSLLSLKNSRMYLYLQSLLQRPTKIYIFYTFIFILQIILVFFSTAAR